MSSRADSSTEYRSNSSSIQADDVQLKSLHGTMLASSVLNSSMENCFHRRPTMGGRRDLWSSDWHITRNKTIVGQTYFRDCDPRNSALGACKDEVDAATGFMGCFFHVLRNVKLCH